MTSGSEMDFESSTKVNTRYRYMTIKNRTARHNSKEFCVEIRTFYMKLSHTDPHKTWSNSFLWLSFLWLWLVPGFAATLVHTQVLTCSKIAWAVRALLALSVLVPVRVLVGGASSDSLLDTLPLFPALVDPFDLLLHNFNGQFFGVGGGSQWLLLLITWFWFGNLEPVELLMIEPVELVVILRVLAVVLDVLVVSALAESELAVLFRFTGLAHWLVSLWLFLTLSVLLFLIFHSKDRTTKIKLIEAIICSIIWSKIA